MKTTKQTSMDTDTILSSQISPINAMSRLVSSALMLFADFVVIESLLLNSGMTPFSQHLLTFAYLICFSVKTF